QPTLCCASAPIGSLTTIPRCSRIFLISASASVCSWPALTLAHRARCQIGNRRRPPPSYHCLSQVHSRRISGELPEQRRFFSCCRTKPPRVRTHKRNTSLSKRVSTQRCNSFFLDFYLGSAQNPRKRGAWHASTLFPQQRA